MGLLDRLKKAPLAEEVPMLFLRKEVLHLRGELFSDEPEAELLSLLGLAAPLLGKDGQKVDRFPEYAGKSRERIEAIYQGSFGEMSRENLMKQFEMLLSCEESAPFSRVYQIMRGEPVKHWGDLLSREGYSAQQLEKIERMEKIVETLAQYEFVLPAQSLAAFDLARAANLAAVGGGLGILTREESIALLERVQERAVAEYEGWSDYYAGYALGRGIYAWSQEKYVLMDAPAVRNICRMLLVSAQSPYRNVPFGTK